MGFGGKGGEGMAKAGDGGRFSDLSGGCDGYLGCGGW